MDLTCMLLVISFFHCVLSECEFNCTLQDKILGGEYSEKGEWPMMVALMSKPDVRQFCGGAVISRRHVITAGHCVHMHARKIPVHKFGVVYGISDLGEVRLNNIKSPKSIIAHPRYKWPLSYDIAILVLNEIDFSENVSPVYLPPQNFNAVGKSLYHTGWGMVKAYGKGSRILKKTILQGVDLDLCNDTFSQYAHAVQVREHHMCTYQKGTSQCKGDSGGPIMWKDSGKYYLVGIISFGWFTCDTPSVSVDVSHFVPWIQKILNIF